MTQPETDERQPVRTFELVCVQDVRANGHESLRFYRVEHIDGVPDMEKLNDPGRISASMTAYYFGGNGMDKAREELDEFQQALNRGPVLIRYEGKDTWERVE